MPPKKGRGRKVLSSSQREKGQEVMEDVHDPTDDDDSELDERNSPTPSPAPAAVPPAPPRSPTPNVSAGVSKTEEGRKHRRREKLVLHPEDEQSVADWYNNTPALWNKHEKLYKDKDKRAKLLADKAKTLKRTCTGEQLWVWLQSIRTAYGKLIKAGPSGGPKVHPTEKEEWIMKNFQCLGGMINRHSKTRYSQVKARSKPDTEPAPGTSGQQTGRMDLSSDEEGIYFSEEEMSGASTPRKRKKTFKNPPAKTSKGKMSAGGSGGEAPVPVHELAATLQSRLENMQRLQGLQDTGIHDPGRERKAFFSWALEKALKLEEDDYQAMEAAIYSEFARIRRERLASREFVPPVPQFQPLHTTPVSSQQYSTGPATSGYGAPALYSTSPTKEEQDEVYGDDFCN